MVPFLPLPISRAASTRPNQTGTPRQSTLTPCCQPRRWAWRDSFVVAELWFPFLVADTARSLHHYSLKGRKREAAPVGSTSMMGFLVRVIKDPPRHSWL